MVFTLPSPRYSRWPPSVRELLRPNPWGQISFCRQNVFTMTFALDPSTEQGRSVLGYVTDLHKQGAPIRFGLILAPGAAGGRGAAGGIAGAHRPPPMVQGSATRLAALASAYTHPAWGAADAIKELEARAAAVVGGGGVGAGWGGKDEGGSGGGGGGEVALSEEEEEEEALGMLLTKLFFFCRRKLGASASLRFLELTREVRGHCYRARKEASWVRGWDGWGGTSQATPVLPNRAGSSSTHGRCVAFRLGGHLCE
jgi:hypothetical protein